MLAILACAGLLAGGKAAAMADKPAVAAAGYIKWVDFKPSAATMSKALGLDVDSRGQAVELDWIELLAFLAAKYGGNFSRYKAADLESIAARLKNGEKIEDITNGMKYYNFYHTAYTAILGGFVGEYYIQEYKNGETSWVKKYGLQVFSPIAAGHGYSHYDDFGDSRSYGFARQHLGNDLMGSVGTPVIAVESGYVEALGWNRYGGWRIGIRSHDRKRYYYYAHLRKDKPYRKGLVVGQTVEAGDVIGYLGMTGYSTKENKNNIKTPHLHFGMQIIFDESQKESVNEIWIDVYDIVELLRRNRSQVVWDAELKDYVRRCDISFGIGPPE